MGKHVVEQWHWRNTSRPIRFFQFDGRAGLFVGLVLVHIRLSTIVMLVCALFVFRILEQKGLSFPAAIRRARVYFIGKYRPAWVYTRRRKLLDTGG